jgi:capsule biosynthesis phosphatase
VDLDGTLCELKGPNETYADVLPKPGAVKATHRLKATGHEVIIYTARNMRTYKGNVGKVQANMGKMTLDWLAQHGFHFDEIIFGKPQGDVYIDDLAITFKGWDQAMLTLGCNYSPDNPLLT